MIDAERGIVLRQVGTLFRAGTFAGMSDGQLLDHFLARGGEAGELAFAVLVERHGPMVLRVCRGVLGDRHDAEDAFQATFLALVRGAGSIRRRDSVAPWLHEAALRVSACARSAGARRRRHEGQSAARRPDSARDREPDDLSAIIHEELARLPARYRAAVALCDLEGLSLDEVGRHLGCPVGTVKSRVARGRERLRGRLVRRGIVPASAAIGLTLTRGVTAAVRPALIDVTSRAAAQLAAGRGVVGLLAASVETLVRNEARRVLMRRIGTVTATLATAGVLMAGANLLGQQGAPGANTDRGRMGMMADMLAGQAPAAAPKGSTFVKVYSVVDILGEAGRGRVDMTPLVELVTSSVTPGVWRVLDSHGGSVDDRDGSRSIMPSSRDLTLIIRQTAEGHDQVAERLEQLRQIVSVREARQTTAVTAEKAPGQQPPYGAMMGMMQAMRRGGTQPDGPPIARIDGVVTENLDGGAPAAIKAASPVTAGVVPGADRVNRISVQVHPVPPGMPAQGTPPPGAAAPRALPVPPTAPAPPAAPGAVPMPPAAPPVAAAPAAMPLVRQYDTNVTYPVDARRTRSGPFQTFGEAETERRLRVLEEKLDRVLKALDATGPDKPGGDALRK